MVDMAFASALEQAELVRTKQVSPVELVELYATRIEKLNPELNAFITPALDRALDDARGAERTPSDAPFHGVPISIKDLNDTAGLRTTQGSAAFADRIPEKDDDDPQGSAIDEDRLAVFRDLVNSLDLPDLPDEPGSRGQGPSTS